MRRERKILITMLQRLDRRDRIYIIAVIIKRFILHRMYSNKTMKTWAAFLSQSLFRLFLNLSNTHCFARMACQPLP